MGEGVGTAMCHSPEQCHRETPGSTQGTQTCSFYVSLSLNAKLRVFGMSENGNRGFARTGWPEGPRNLLP